MLCYTALLYLHGGYCCTLLLAEGNHHYLRAVENVCMFTSLKTLVACNLLRHTVEALHIHVCILKSPLAGSASSLV